MLPEYANSHRTSNGSAERSWFWRDVLLTCRIQAPKKGTTFGYAVHKWCLLCRWMLDTLLVIYLFQEYHNTWCIDSAAQLAAALLYYTHSRGWMYRLLVHGNICCHANAGIEARFHRCPKGTFRSQIVSPSASFGLCVTIRAAHHLIYCCGKFLVFISWPYVKKAKPSRMVKHNVIEKNLVLPIAASERCRFRRGWFPFWCVAEGAAQTLSSCPESKKIYKEVDLCYEAVAKQCFSFNLYIFARSLTQQQAYWKRWQMTAFGYLLLANVSSHWWSATRGTMPSSLAFSSA